ncbi:MAG: flagellar assembly protein FliW [Sporomusaceae bacterium]|nr:flagellar assembly protein FliW [Sporomusaceae bacterium]
MHTRSTRLGQIEFVETDRVTFPDGLPGFADETDFVLMPEADTPFAFLQSLHDPDLTFVLADPFAFYSDYSIELDAQCVAKLALSEDNRPQIWCIVTVPKQPADMTANLLAPVIANRRDNIACQYVLEKSGYTTRHRLFPQPAPQGGE